MTRRRQSLLVALALGTAVFAGCAPAPTDLSRDASSEMQAAVVSVAEAAAAGDAATALARLDELQQQLDAALAAGRVSAERASAIQAAIDVVRGDLQPVATPTVTPAPDQTDVVDDDGDPAGENSGPGENSGKGKGSDKKDDKDD